VRRRGVIRIACAIQEASPSTDRETAITRRVFYVAAIGVLIGGLATPASAQFDPLHNNLKCYKITGPSLAVNLQLDNQFGRERVLKLVPQFLCAPTQKTCCAAATATTVCQPIPCPPEPSPNQPAAVDHFKCYKIQVKECTPTTAGTFDCSKLIGRFPPVPPPITATLVDQFHTEDVTLSKPKMLCVPVLKIRGTTTTTTPPPTTTTTLCVPPNCPTTTTTTTATTTTTTPCAEVPGVTPPMCGGDCPAPLACVNITPGGTTVQCNCETPCGLNSAMQCTGFCPSAAQQCARTATNPCGCCPSTGASCTPGSIDECCVGQCNAAGTCP